MGMKVGIPKSGKGREEKITVMSQPWQPNKYNSEIFTKRRQCGCHYVQIVLSKRWKLWEIQEANAQQSVQTKFVSIE